MAMRTRDVIHRTSRTVRLRPRRAFGTGAGARPSSPSSSPPPPPFRKILVANRGEIAARVILGARLRGVRTVAVYSTADARSPFVSMADEAVCVGPPASSESYLDVDGVLEAVEMTGSEGVHPGYGFLSENHLFAERVAAMRVNEAPHGSVRVNPNPNEQFVKFIGPSASAILSLGDKIQSKLLAQAAGVSIIPGFNGVVTSPDHAIQIAQNIGYPVMIKASSGGGGKGMRVCHTDAQLKQGYHLSSAEAKNFFADDRLLVEKYIENPHHIEIQVLSGRDPQTNTLQVIAFPERECSIQRRNQKVIEESPSPNLTPNLRREMIKQATSLVKKVGYESAGTVEFLLDRQNQNFYFLEMNTRLQVEHPITEMISGDGHASPSNNCVDLVHGMLEVAAGRGVPPEYLHLLDAEGAAVTHKGHAIEARVYAEDPLRGFLPSTGPLVHYAEPPPLLDVGGEDGPCHIRVDAGVAPGSIVTPHYDPILSKVISYSPVSRAHAIRGLGEALDRYVLRGVRHNVPFMRDVLRNDDFKEGNTPTGFIDAHYPVGFEGGRLSERERRELAAIAGEMAKRGGSPANGTRPASSGGGGDEEGVVVCPGGMFGDAYLVRSRVGPGDGRDVAASVTRLGTAGEDEADAVNLSGLEYDSSSGLAHVEIAGESRTLQVHGEDEVGTLGLTMYGSNADVLVMTPAEYGLSRHMIEPSPPDTGNFVLSPMPGTLVSFAVKEGDTVELDQELCVVEAMKMQNVVRSPRAGAVVGRLHGATGASLRADEIILEFEGAEPGGSSGVPATPPS